MPPNVTDFKPLRHVEMSMTSIYKLPAPLGCGRNIMWTMYYCGLSLIVLRFQN